MLRFDLECFLILFIRVVVQCPRWKVGLASTSSARPGTHWAQVFAFFRWPTSHLPMWPFEVPWAKLASMFAPSDEGGLGLAATIDQWPIISNHYRYSLLKFHCALHMIRKYRSYCMGGCVCMFHLWHWSTYSACAHAGGSTQAAKLLKAASGSFWTREQVAPGLVTSRTPFTHPLPYFNIFQALSGKTNFV